MGKYFTDILKDFNLSIIMPFYRKFDAFSRILPLNANLFSRNGIEVIIVLDEPSQKKQVLDLIKCYPLINWIIILNRNEHPWRNPSRAINVGIKNASKKYTMVCSPESYFETDAIFRLRVVVEFYEASFAVGKVYFNTYGDFSLNSNMGLSYGSIMVKKSHLINVGCYQEEFDNWGGEDDQIRHKLEFYGYKKIYVDDAILIHFDGSPSEIVNRNQKSREIPDYTYQYSQRPSSKNLEQRNWGKDFDEIIFDYRKKKLDLEID
ncbi:hypothetical protein DHW03_14995 [Pedobacter yonginense]|uniref:Uncharacterized protein n=1 Tax=Pedobacter yonginense TaxID=651869 RepID=A0A317EJR0_9SPHI|nr:glycosyltransferase [Pedobacter yonginense]PWS26103.1 hypothetical protein DHW03_14995 [Pedobacter yonginense]